MSTSNCTIIGQKSRGGNTYAASAVYMGYGSTGYTHYEYVLSFKTGDFAGKSNSITFNIKMSNSSQGASRTYRWALLKSDSSVVGRDTSVNLYFDKHDEVTDPNQLAQGTITWTDMNKDTHKVLVIETTELKANTNYFLVLWAYSTNPTSFVTVSHTQWHGDILVEYVNKCLITALHRLEGDSGGYNHYKVTYDEVVPGASWTPDVIEVPSTHIVDGATFKAWDAVYALVGGGVVGVDHIVVDQDLSVEVYYSKKRGSVCVNVNGVLYEGDVSINIGGTKYDAEAIFVNVNGIAVKA